MKQIVFIADYNDDTLAMSEAMLAVRQLVQKSPNITITPIASRPFNTVHTGFLLAQCNRHLSSAQAKETIFYVNTDPRTHTKKATVAAAGSPLLIAILNNGARVVTPNAGHCLSFVKKDITHLYKAPVSDRGSQFRSRDVFPKAVAGVVDGTIRFATLEEESVDRVQDVPENSVVLHVDNYGNVKTSLTKKDLTQTGLSVGDTIKVRVGKRAVRVVVSDTIFGHQPGTVVLAPGSSGVKNDPYYELSVRFNGKADASGRASFHNPEPGIEVKIIA